MFNSFFYIFMYLLPKSCISHLVGILVTFKKPKFFIKKSVHIFAKIFKINTNEAEKPIDSYDNIQDYFVRSLKTNARTINNQSDIIVSPCDGFISECSNINKETLIQAKGKKYTLSNLIKDSSETEYFTNGYYCTIYLSPKDYHRFHMPIDGKIYKSIYYPGQLWPVNKWSVNNVEQLFCQNERVITFIKINNNINCALIFVAATIVGGINLNYAKMQNRKNKLIVEENHDNICLKKGDELGKFMFGSTIIMLLPQNVSKFIKSSGENIKMGESLAILT